RIVSIFHALVSSIVTCWQIHVSQVFESKDALLLYPNFLEYVFPLYIGYTMYDIILMYVNGSEPLYMWLHHIIGALSICAISYIRRGAYFPAMFLQTEFTAASTNIVWYFHKFGISRGLKYRLSLVFRFVSSLLIRLPMPFYVWYYLYHQIGTYSEVLEAFIELPLFVSIITILNICTFGAINTIWTYQMLKAIFRKQKSL
ncbi:hypothetical protein ROZALSC1DRAFT_18048, partial [Rozella allomycis CSF55]